MSRDQESPYTKHETRNTKHVSHFTFHASRFTSHDCPITSLFYPRGVALVGSVAEGKLGYELARQMVEGGYRDVFVVNPKGQGVFSLPGYQTVAQIERPVDLAVIVSPPATVPGVLEDCGRAGVQAAVIITAGFSEVGNRAGEEEVARVAREQGIRFVGPNCAGIVNTSHRLFPTLETRPPTPPTEGGAAIVAQSGAVGGVVLAWAKEYGLGISKFASYGNGADLNEIDFLRYLAGDEETRVVGLYIETVADGREFMQAVEECAARKPVVVIKAGRTQSGQRATLSHTGSLAGSDAVYDAALRQCGAIRVQTIEEMFDLCQGFLYVGRLSPVGTPVDPHAVGGLHGVGGLRVAIVTNSGGPGVLAADRAEEVGLEVAEPSPAVKARLAEFLPAHCALKNPIDLTVEGTEDGYRRTLLAVLEEYDAALALNIATPYLDSVPLARGICDAARESGKPVVAAFLPGRIVAEAVPYLQEHGVANFATGERAVAALARMAEYEARRKHGCAGLTDKDTPPSEGGGRGRVGLATGCHSPSPQPSPWEGEGERLSPQPSPWEGEGERPSPQPSPWEGEGALLEPEAMAWLRENGLPVPDFRCAPTVEEAVQGCREIGYPAVMKVVSPDILHKSDCGGVVLGIRDDEGARAAFQAIRQAAAGKDFRGVVIYPLIEGGAAPLMEVLLGLSRDPQFGPVVAFGLGGIYTEVWRDVALRVAPVTRAEAESMVRQIRSFPLLAGVRGQPPRDLQALAEALVRLSWLPFRYPEVGEVDLNPVFLFEEGRGLVVGDARVMRNAECGMRIADCGMRIAEHETRSRKNTDLQD